MNGWMQLIILPLARRCDRESVTTDAKNISRATEVRESGPVWWPYIKDTLFSQGLNRLRIGSDLDLIVFLV
jgi:hypothetical protein